MIKRNYIETVDYLYQLLPMYQREGKSAFKKDLTNIIALCEHLGNPQDQFQTLHVAGTNGKGSTSHILSALLQSQGLRVGLYTSPHYISFRERIKINNLFVSEDFVIDFVENLKEVIEEIKPSFFELTVAMAFQYFADQNVDIAVIEVGLGGRLDSTNIINPEISTITNISMDHTNMLGDTVAQIASEKAGIIKNNTPVIISERQEDSSEVFERIALLKNAPIYFAQDIVTFTELDYSTIVFKTEDYEWKIHPTWWSPFQIKNTIGALATYLLYLYNKELSPNPQKEIQFLEKMPDYTLFIGRYQWISQSPRVLADSAHNEAGLQSVFEHIEKHVDYNKLHMVVGFSNDKDLSHILKIFPKDAVYYFAKANVPRGLDAKKIKELALEYGLQGESYSSIKNALEAAKKVCNEDDLIYVGGSIFVIAEVIEYPL